MSNNIGIIGKMFAGKTTFARVFEEQGYSRIAFADPLKEVSVQTLNAMCIKLDTMVGTQRHPSLTRETIEIHKLNPLIRLFIQNIGSLGRYWYGPESLWIDFLVEHVHRHPSTSFVCDDCRMFDEVMALKNLGFVIVKLERNEDERIAHLKNVYGDRLDSILSHSSETDVDKLPYDVLIPSVTPNQLHRVARNFKRN